jgi:hypothetical protein
MVACASGRAAAFALRTANSCLTVSLAASSFTQRFVWGTRSASARLFADSSVSARHLFRSPQKVTLRCACVPDLAQCACPDWAKTGLRSSPIMPIIGVVARPVCGGVRERSEAGVLVVKQRFPKGSSSACIHGANSVQQACGASPHCLRWPQRKSVSPSPCRMANAGQRKNWEKKVYSPPKVCPGRR